MKFKEAFTFTNGGKQKQQSVLVLQQVFSEAECVQARRQRLQAPSPGTALRISASSCHSFLNCLCKHLYLGLFFVFLSQMYPKAILLILSRIYEHSTLGDQGKPVFGFLCGLNAHTLSQTSESLNSGSTWNLLKFPKPTISYLKYF